MSTNPLYPTSHTSHGPADQPAANPAGNPAADLIRQKLAMIYAEAPDTGRELAMDKTAYATPGQHHSKHQQFMHRLSASGKSLADIQTEWHHYYASLSDEDKRAVWQEFYSKSAAAAPASAPTAEPAPAPAPAPAPPASRPNPANIYPTPTALTTPASYRPAAAPAAELPASAPATALPARGQAETVGTSLQYEEDGRTPAGIRQQLRQTVSQRAKLKPRHHLQSLLFGLGCGGLALLVVLFSFFNEMFIAPFLQPSRTVNATPIIIGPDGIAPSEKSEVIIPKINVQIPLDFSAQTIKEDDIQKALEKGVVHYPTTVLPGQNGNAAFFGHSSNNIFNPGQYKFAFVLLHELVPGDTFYLTRDGTAYAYQVIDKKVVEPTEIGVLDPIPGKNATATLITCDPPGTTLRRLAVIGEQVTPNPTANSPGAPAPLAQPDSGQALPGPAPSLWRRLTSFL